MGTKEAFVRDDMALWTGLHQPLQPVNADTPAMRSAVFHCLSSYFFFSQYVVTPHENSMETNFSGTGGRDRVPFSMFVNSPSTRDYRN